MPWGFQASCGLRPHLSLERGVPRKTLQSAPPRHAPHRYLMCDHRSVAAQCTSACFLTSWFEKTETRETGSLTIEMACILYTHSRSGRPHGHTSTCRPGGSPREPTGRFASVKCRSRRAAGSPPPPRATSFARAPSESRGWRRRSIGPHRHSCAVAPAEPAWSVQLARSSGSCCSISPSSAWFGFGFGFGFGLGSGLGLALGFGFGFEFGFGGTG